MRNGITSTGFSWTFDETRADDVRFVELLAQIQAPETAEMDRLISASKVVGMLLGEEQKAALYDHIGSRHEGRVPFAELFAALSEIMQGGGDAVKN